MKKKLILTSILVVGLSATQVTKPVWGLDSLLSSVGLPKSAELLNISKAIASNHISWSKVGILIPNTYQISLESWNTIKGAMPTITAIRNHVNELIVIANKVKQSEDKMGIVSEFIEKLFDVGIDAGQILQKLMAIAKDFARPSNKLTATKKYTGPIYIMHDAWGNYVWEQVTKLEIPVKNLLDMIPKVRTIIKAAFGAAEAEIKKAEEEAAKAKAEVEKVKAAATA